MFKNKTELQEFIIWCRENSIKSFSNSEITFEISEIALIPEANNINTADLKEINLNDHKTFSELSNMYTRS